MSIKGKGFFIFQIPDCEGGDPRAIAETAEAAGLAHIWLKIADGTNPFGVGITQPVVAALHAKGIAVWGWHYVYGNDPSGEASVALRRVSELKLDGYVVNAEVEYKNKQASARRFMSDLREALPDVPIALSSYRFPDFHPELPWAEFLEKCDYHWPQVYWVEAHNAGAQLRTSKKHCDALPNAKPYYATGAAYSDNPNKWNPTAADVQDFLDSARVLGLEAVNFFSWDYCRAHYPAIWQTISDFTWPVPSPVIFAEAYLAALNAHDADAVTALYADNATLVTRDRILRGAGAIRVWYGQYFDSMLPEATFTFKKTNKMGDMHFINWDADSSAGQVRKGRDTVMLSRGKVSLHFSFFTIR
ncbi:MAG: nuclear transport factor 2 family protein [Anaerolineales bacterium]|nr:nuclear transport factor 2 family protein [Anaerolineales bacterium]